MVERDEHGAPDEFWAQWRASYRRLNAPSLPDDLEGADARTRAAVGWMQAAWSELGVPAAPLPKRLRRGARGNLPQRFFAQRGLVLLAALVLLALGLWLLGPAEYELKNRELRLGIGDGQSVLSALEAESLPAAEPESPIPGALTQSSTSSRKAQQSAKLSVSAGQADNNIEFRSGRVTLVLVTGA